MTHLRKAILVGSEKYKSSPLNFSIKDVSDLSNILEDKCKFSSDNIYTIQFGKREDEYDFRSKFDAITQEIESNRKNVLDLVLFYYSGHGFYNTEEDVSYLKITDNQDISIIEIIQKIALIKSKNKYIIVDACFSGGISIFNANAKSYFDRKYKFNSEGLYLLFGATSNNMSYEPSLKHQIEKHIRNSYFTFFILEALSDRTKYQDGTISIKIIDDHASRKTAAYTDFMQIPYSSTQTSGFFPLGYWEENQKYVDIRSILTSDVIEQNSQSNESEIIDYLVNRITKLFNKESLTIMNYEKELLNNLSQPAIDIINNRLKFNYAKLNGHPFLHGLILSKEYDMFLDFLLKQSVIRLDFQCKDKNGRNILQLCVEDETIRYPLHYISLIFKNGYKASLDEFEYYKGLFNREPIEPGFLERITFTLIHIKVDSPIFHDLIYSNYKILFAILSFKHNKVIGYKLNFLALANNFLQYHSDHGEFFIKALKHYNHYDYLIKNSSFQRKITEFESRPIYQNADLIDLFSRLLPELK